MRPVSRSMNMRGLVLGPADPRHLQRAADGNNGGRPPRQRREIHAGAEAIQQAGNGASDGAAGGAGGRGEPVDLPEVVGARSRLFDQDEQQRVRQDVEEVAQQQARVDAGVHVLRRQQHQVRHHEVRQRVPDCDDYEQLPHPQP